MPQWRATRHWSNDIANLLDNTVPGGPAEISTCVESEKASVCIANTLPVIPPEQVHRLFSTPSSDSTAPASTTTSASDCSSPRQRHRHRP